MALNWTEPAKVWTGSRWNQCPVKVHNGTSWVEEVPMLDFDSAWYINEGSGGTTVDDPGTSDMTLSGPMWSTNSPPTGDTSYSLDFDGTDDYCYASTNPYGTNPGTLAMEAWVYPRAGDRRNIAGQYQVFDWTWDDMVSQGFDFRIWGDNTSGLVSPSGLAYNSWHHCNVYWNIGTEVGMSVNGGSWQTYSTTDSLDSINNDFKLGTYSQGGGAFWDGLIGPVRLKTGQRIPIEQSLY